MQVLGYFNPRSPWGERRITAWMLVLLIRFQSTLPVGGATYLAAICWSIIKISIHAPRGGSDQG